MNVIGDIMFPTGKYQTREGEEKTRWLKCGVLMQNTEGNYRIKLEAMPLGVEPDGAWFAVFEKKAEPKPQAQTRPMADLMKEDMPF
jgi:hypothetical protein